MPKRVKVIGDLFHGRIPEGAVYIGRAMPGLKQSPFANRWVVRRAVHSLDGTTDGWVVSHHRNRQWTLGSYPDRDAALKVAVAAFKHDLAESEWLRERAISKLSGKDLACWCKPSDPCHGDALITFLAASSTRESETRP